jgi:SNARE domain
VVLTPRLSAENIESNVISIARDTQGASEELGHASEYQRKAGRRAACLMLIIVIVICIVLLAVSFPGRAPGKMIPTLNVYPDPGLIPLWTYPPSTTVCHIYLVRSSFNTRLQLCDLCPLLVLVPIPTSTFGALQSPTTFLQLLLVLSTIFLLMYGTRCTRTLRR